MESILLLLVIGCSYCNSWRWHFILLYPWTTSIVESSCFDSGCSCFWCEWFDHLLHLNGYCSHCSWWRDNSSAGRLTSYTTHRVIFCFFFPYMSVKVAISGFRWNEVHRYQYFLLAISLLETVEPLIFCAIVDSILENAICLWCHVLEVIRLNLE